MSKLDPQLATISVNKLQESQSPTMNYTEPQKSHNNPQLVAINRNELLQLDSNPQSKQILNHFAKLAKWLSCLSDRNWTETQNHVVCKRTFNHLTATG